MQLTVTPYHKNIVEHFKQQQKTWDFFARETNKEKQLEELKTELLKNTYKFDEATNETLYNKVNVAKAKLNLQLNVTLYQAQYSDELNASIVGIDNDAHIIFCGSILKNLNDEEVLAIIAHELTHIKLYNMLGGDVGIADRIITSISNSQSSDTAYYETAKLFKLYTEIFCDRGAYEVTGKIEPIISSLLKMATGLDNIQVESYLKQAEEIYSKDKATKTEQITHPENFIRARAINLWHLQEPKAENIITEMIEGNATLDSLDLFQQKELSDITKQLLQLFLKPKWIQSTLVLSLARQYFSGFSPDAKALLTKEFIEKIEAKHTSIKDYFGYLLLDFALTDVNLENIPLGWAFQFAEDIGIKEQFKAIVKKELQLTEKKLQQKQEQSLAAFASVKENEAEQVYE